MDADRLRHSFFEFFRKHGHRVVRSSALIPADDPTLLFTNAGMNQFKDYFLGNAVPEYRRAVTCQKVMRAGGKHNDLENVGRTARHHTFFEMLGNFSFGDYFKEDAIRFAWAFLTEELRIPPDKLAVSVYEKDDDAFALWNRMIGIPAERIARLGEKDNFWAMGDTGPCGPCSEIHYDLNGDNGKTPAQSLVEDDGRFLEIWNLVFMQFDRQKDGTMTPLPKPSIDTGMGLERIASVMAHVKSNYETSLFEPLLADIARNAGYTYGTDAEKDVSCKVIADHVRALTFLIQDGLIPGNDGRGYVMRRILRRAARHARNLGAADGFLAQTVPSVVRIMKGAYPEISEAQTYIEKIIFTEEKRFSGTLHHGMKYLEDLIESAQKSGSRTVSGADIFKLYDTYGFPTDLADDILQDKELSYDISVYNAEMDAQKEKARSAQEGMRTNRKVQPIYKTLRENLSGLTFSGYQTLKTDTDAVSLIKNGAETNTLKGADEFEIILRNTPFYAEGGGQTGDTGIIENDRLQLRVTDTFKPFPGFHICRVKPVSLPDGVLNLSDCKGLHASVDRERRQEIQIHHTATHLLHNGLRHILGEHVKQAGSLVESGRLRFDFSHYAPVEAHTLQMIEEYVNGLVRRNYQVSTEELPLEQALRKGALAFFGEKYGESVRVVSAGPSVELCGGCHVSATGEISFIKIVSEESVAAGVRRIEAYAGESVADYILKRLECLSESARLAGVKPEELPDKINKLEDELKQVQRQNRELKTRMFKDHITSGRFSERVGAIELTQYQVGSDEELNEFANVLMKVKPAGHVGVLYKSEADKINLVLTVTDDLHSRLKAGELIRTLSPIIDGKGGGKDISARCGGNLPAKLPDLITALKQYVIQ